MQRDDHSSDVRLSRRTLLAGAAAGTLAVAPDTASAQRCPAPPRPKGPLVWLDIDQQELDAAYDQIKLCLQPGQDQERRQGRARGARALLGEPPQRVAYGPSRDREARHLPHQASERAGQRLHPWRRLAQRPRRRLRLSGRDRSCRPAPTASSWISSMSVDAGGDLIPMVDQVRSAVAFDLSERRELRRRSRPALCQRPFLRRPSRRPRW